MLDRIHNKGFRSELVSAEDAAALAESGQNTGSSGPTGAEYPKEFPKALTVRIEVAHGKSEEFRIGIWTGASTVPELDGVLAHTGGIAFRASYQSDPEIHTATNKGITNYYDIHFSYMGLQASRGLPGPLHLAAVEATAIAEDGDIVSSFSVGLSRTYLEQVDRVIIEVNSRQFEDLFGIHDVYYLTDVLSPNRDTLPITSTDGRIGDKVSKVNANEVVVVVETNAMDRSTPFKPPGDDSRVITGYLPDFPTNEAKHGRLPENLLPLQSGVDNIANATLMGLPEGPFENPTFYTEVIQDGMVDLIGAGKVTVASGTAFSLSPEAMERMNEKIRFYRDHIILRPMGVSSYPEVIRRMGVIACNDMIEADIYDNANSIHVVGSRVMNGIGGSGDFTRNGYFPSFVTPSTAKGGVISAAVPMVSHVDYIEHDADVIITEQGLADPCGLAPRQRAQTIIENCTHPDSREPLREYAKLVATKANDQQTLHDLVAVPNWHVYFLGTGSMR